MYINHSKSAVLVEVPDKFSSEAPALYDPSYCSYQDCDVVTALSKEVATALKYTGKDNRFIHYELCIHYWIIRVCYSRASPGETK